MSTPPIVGVSGGVAGVEAEWAAALALADELDLAGDTARAWAALGPQVASDGDLVASAALAPVTFALAEAAVLRATTGPEGALGRSVAWEAAAVAVRVAVARLRAADLATAAAVRSGEHALGQVLAGVGLAGAVTVATTAPWLGPAWVGLPPTLRARLGATASVTLQEAAIAHPDAVETLFGSSGGLIDGVLTPLSPVPRHLGTPQGAGLVADLYDDGRPSVRERPDVGLPGSSLGRPRDLAGLVTALSGVARLSTGSSSPLNGTIAVTTLREHGRTRHVVYLPGTDDMTTRPWTQDHDVRDMGTNLTLAAGRPTTYGAGVLEAMADAGIGPDDPVLLVGHSQGGMQAGALAASDPPFHVTHVVTAGSPLAPVDLPDDVRALSIENRGDVVPLTDGGPNRPAVGHVTVTVDAGGDGVVGRHDYPRYVEGAAAVDATDDPSVRAALDDLRSAGFLGDDTAEARTRVFQITRR